MDDKHVDDVQLPVPFVHIEPVFGEIVEIRFDTVRNVLYGVVVEFTQYERWTLCYAAQSLGVNCYGNYVQWIGCSGQIPWKYRR